MERRREARDAVQERTPEDAGAAPLSTGSAQTDLETSQLADLDPVDPALAGGSNGAAVVNHTAAAGTTDNDPLSDSAAADAARPVSAWGRAWRSYRNDVVVLAQDIVDAQRPIRILQALRWEPTVEEAFRKSGNRELPIVGPDQYAKTDLGFDPASKADEFESILRATERQLGPQDPVGRILIATAYEYREVARMLSVRGTRAFYEYSRALYGSPKDRLPDSTTSVREVGDVLHRALDSIAGPELGPSLPRDLTAEAAAASLRQKLSAYFDGAPVHVEVDDSMLADAAAGSDYVKIRSGARFSQRDLDLLEVHEGWVHVATSLNGQYQPTARWLAKGPPRTAAVQEGLAAMAEIVTCRSYPKRARKLNDRVIAVDMAEDGANFMDVFEWYRTEGYEEDESFANTRRVFRGGLLEGGAPFTKDACYCKGLALNYFFLRAALRNKRPELVPYLFVGKVAHEDIPVLYSMVADGIVRPPVHVPPIFRDLNGLAMGLVYSIALAPIAGALIDDYYARLLR